MLEGLGLLLLFLIGIGIFALVVVWQYKRDEAKRSEAKRKEQGKTRTWFKEQFRSAYKTYPEEKHAKKEGTKNFTPWFWIPSIKDSPSPVLGIDLGTVYSAAGIIYKNKVHIIENKYGEKKEPSLVSVTKKGIIYVGKEARESLERYESISHSIGSIKRKMGDIGGTVIANGKKIYPQVVSALILAKLKNQAEKTFGIEFNNAVISVPANFTAKQRQSTYEAAELAHLRVLRITNEAVASAVSYACNVASGLDRRVFVIDFGGGTLDLAIISCGLAGKNQEAIEVKAVGGDNCLGGIDFTQRLYEYLKEQIESDKSEILLEDEVNNKRLLEIVEQAKIALSSQLSTDVHIPYLKTKSGNSVTININVERQTYENLIKDLLDKMTKCIETVIKDSGLSYQDIDAVVAVGGVSKTPCIKKKVEDIFNKKIEGLKYADPDFAVVTGTVLMGAVLGGSLDNLLVLDAFPQSLSIGVSEGKCSKLIAKNTTIPTIKTSMFTTTQDNQTTVDIPLYEGEGENVRNNKLLCYFTLHDIPPAKKGVPQIEVTIGIDANNIVNISAKDTGTGRTVQERVNIYSSLTIREKEGIKKQIHDWVSFNKMFDL